MPGREEEYDRWYRAVHMNDVLALPGIVSAQRFRKLGRPSQAPAEFVATYTVETADPPALLQSLFAAAATMTLTNAMDPASPRFEFLMSPD